MGHMVDAFQADHFEPLDAEAEDNIIGLQGHIWGENARSPEMLHYFVFPKLLAMAERAWAQKPEWEKQALPGARESDWSQFLSVLGLRELPRLAERGIAYRIPLPGAMVQNDTLYMNNLFPGLTAVYQIDNGNRLIYESPVRLMDRDGSTIRIWNEDRIGRQSRKTLITF
jgi:hexosaminidase